MQFASFGVSLRALSGASCGSSEEVFVLFPIVGSRATKRKRRKSENKNGKALDKRGLFVI
jgi:hypothetical protein